MRRVLIALALLLLATPLLIASIDLNQVANDNGAVLRHDYWREIGFIERGEVRISFRPGEPWLLDSSGTKVVIDYICYDEKERLIVGPVAQRCLEELLNQHNAEDRQKVAAIILDPGHGGRDSGTLSPFPIKGKPLYEKDIVLDIALQVYAKLKRTYPGKRIMMTRSDDIYLSLEQRTDKANSVKLGKNEAVVFVSIHANASFRKTASGFEVWYLPPEMKRDMVSDTMRADIGEQSVLNILNRLLDEETTVESIKLAGAILNGMADKIEDRSINRGLKEEAWYVVRNAKMPSVLIEVGFVTNSKEANMLATKSYRSDLATGITTGICRFITQFEKSNGFTKKEE